MNTLTMTCALLLAASACSNNREPQYPGDDCVDDAGDQLGNAAEVTGQGIEAGMETGVAGVKQAAKATGGLVTGGTDGAADEWEEGRTDTRREALEGESEIATAQRPRCPERQPR